MEVGGAFGVIPLSIGQLAQLDQAPVNSVKPTVTQRVWSDSADHKTKQVDVNVRRRFVGKSRDGWGGRKMGGELRMASLHHAHAWNCPRTTLIAFWKQKVTYSKYLGLPDLHK